MPLTTLGAVLLTFKPHTGALVLLSALIYLVWRGGTFGARALRSILVAGVILFLAGFVADPAWPISYPGMLLEYQNEGNVTACSECASLPVWLSRLFLDGSLAKAALVAVLLLILLVAMFSLLRKALSKSPSLLLTSALLITLLISPYLYNYDYMLLLVPFAILVGSSTGTINKILVLACFLIPTFTIAFLGRDGNISLILVTFLITLLLYLHVKKPDIDVPAYAS